MIGLILMVPVYAVQSVSRQAAQLLFVFCPNVSAQEVAFVLPKFVYSSCNSSDTQSENLNAEYIAVIPNELQFLSIIFIYFKYTSPFSVLN